MAESISSLIVAAALVSVILFFDRLIVRAESSPSRSGLRWVLYGIFGLLGIAFFVFGIVQLLLGGDDGETRVAGATLIVLAGITAIVLASVSRNWLAMVIPFDPTSPRDTLGLLVILWLVAARAAEYFLDTSLEGSVTYGALIVQAITLSAIALAIVGLFTRRNPASAMRRLGLVRPSGRQIWIAVSLVVVIVVLGGIANLILEAIDPSIYEELDETLGEITGELDLVWGAIAIGLTAAIGEELLFRGAIQPKYGLIFTAIVFSFLHVQYNPALVFTSVLPAGLILGLERKYLNTTACIITHAIYNGLAVLFS